MPNFPGQGTPQAPRTPFVNPAMPMKPGQPAINPASIPNPNPTNNNMIGGFNNMDPRVGRSFPRPTTMPSSAMPMKGQYRQGLPGGPGGGPGMPPPRMGHPGGPGGQGMPAWMEPWRAAIEAWRAQRPAIAPQPQPNPNIAPYQASLQAWAAQRPQDMTDPAAVAAWRAAMPPKPDFNFGNDRSGGGQDPAFAAWRAAQPNRQDFMPPQLPADAPRLGGTQNRGFPFGGFRARGGNVRGGHSYVVGEEGPEVIVPSSRGTVIPARGTGGGVRTTTNLKPDIVKPNISKDAYRRMHSATPTPTPTPTTPGTWPNAEYGVNEYGGKGHIPGESIQDYFRRNMMAVFKGHAAAGDFGTPTPRPGTTPTPSPGGAGGIPLPPATGGVGVGGGPMSPGMAFTLNNMTPMRGFQFPNYTQTWAMNPDVFGRTY